MDGSTPLIPYRFSPCQSPSCPSSWGVQGHRVGWGRGWGAARWGGGRRCTTASSAGTSWRPAARGRARCLGAEHGVKAGRTVPLPNLPAPTAPCPSPLTLDLEVRGQQADVGDSDVPRVPIVKLHHHRLRVILLLVAGGACRAGRAVGMGRGSPTPPQLPQPPPQPASHLAPRSLGRGTGISGSSRRRRGCPGGGCDATGAGRRGPARKQRAGLRRTPLPPRYPRPGPPASLTASCSSCSCE